ncbi:Dihydrofolate reductase [compost metagenome]
MTDASEEQVLWPLTGEPMVHGKHPMELSFGGHSITVPLSGWWVKEANDGIVDPAAGDIADRVLAILRARARGLRITAVAAADEEWGIGRSGGLPWRCPEDLKHFKGRTLGGTLLMGRTTFEGLPRKLEGRTIHVVSSSGPEAFASADRAIATLAPADLAEIIVAGGGRLYDAALPFCTHAEVTRIRGRHECDAFMPDLAARGWAPARTEALTEEINIEYWETSK